VTNKIDLAGLAPGREAHGAEVRLRLSARTGEGVEALRAWLLEVAGWRPSSEGVFLARERHLVALREAAARLEAAAGIARKPLNICRRTQIGAAFAGIHHRGGHCGRAAGQIFSRFCIGK